MIPWSIFWSRYCDHMSRLVEEQPGFSGSVRLWGQQQAFILTADCDLQAPPDGESRKMQQQHLRTASKVSGWLYINANSVTSVVQHKQLVKCFITYFARQAITTESLSPGETSTSMSSLTSPPSTGACSLKAHFTLIMSFESPTCFFEDGEQFLCKGDCLGLCNVDLLTVTSVNCSSESQPANSQPFSVCVSKPWFLLRFVKNRELCTTYKILLCKTFIISQTGINCRGDYKLTVSRTPAQVSPQYSLLRTDHSLKYQALLCFPRAQPGEEVLQKNSFNRETTLSKSFWKGQTSIQCSNNKSRSHLRQNFWSTTKQKHSSITITVFSGV